MIDGFGTRTLHRESRGRNTYAPGALSGLTEPGRMVKVAFVGSSAAWVADSVRASFIAGNVERTARGAPPLNLVALGPEAVR